MYFFLTNITLVTAVNNKTKFYFIFHFSSNEEQEKNSPTNRYKKSKPFKNVINHQQRKKNQFAPKIKEKRTKEKIKKWIPPIREYISTKINYNHRSLIRQNGFN